MSNPRLILPYVSVAPGVREALEATGWKWDEVYVGGSDESYWGLFHELWAEGETFFIVEHDVIVEPRSLDRLNNCPKNWCAYPIPYLSGEYPGMACVKFTDLLIQAVPKAIERVGRMSTHGHSVRHWCTVDAFLRHELLSAGYRQCVHTPALEHWRDYEERPQPSHGCCGSRVESRP